MQSCLQLGFALGFLLVVLRPSPLAGFVLSIQVVNVIAVDRLVAGYTVRSPHIVAPRSIRQLWRRLHRSAAAGATAATQFVVFNLIFI
jgi:hypothetical protein